VAALTDDLGKGRIDHIGSLVRPATLKSIFTRFDRGQASREELTKAQDQAIRDVIQKQPTVNFAGTAFRKVFPSA
jgi:5-methyltetrahydropteroyltriglutamate--homocysteine methyltransferase